MIPIPHAGVFKGCGGIDLAEAVPGVESVQITAKLNYPITPLPKGDSYLGFIFAKANTPDVVEAVLREAHEKLHFEILELLPML